MFHMKILANFTLSDRLVSFGGQSLCEWQKNMRLRDKTELSKAKRDRRACTKLTLNPGNVVDGFSARLFV